MRTIVVAGFVVGRRAYDNWLVDNAFHDEGMDLIDASNTILAVHLTAADGNKVTALTVFSIAPFMCMRACLFAGMSTMV